MIENATPIELVDGSNFLIDDAGIYIINVDAMTHMMTVTKKEVVPVEPKYYAIGTFQENPWVTEEAWEMENNEVTIDLEAGGKFKIITPADDTENGYRYFGGEDANDVGYFLVEEGMMEAGIALTLDSPGADFMIEEGGNFTLRLIKDEDVAPSGMPKAPVEGMKLLVIRNSTTGINDIAVENIASVKYVNMAGQVSATPFDGVNIKVITLTNGKTRTVKVVK